MRKCLWHVRVVGMIVLGAFVFASPNIFSDQKLPVEPETVGEATPKVQQDAMFNLLKGITALKYVYAQTVAADNKQYAIGSSGLEVMLNPDNAQKILETVTAQAVRDLQDYERYLLKLIKEIDSTSSDNPIILPSLEKTLKSRWLEYGSRIATDKIKTARDTHVAKSFTEKFMLTAAVPLVGILIHGINTENAGLYGMSSIVVGVVSVLGMMYSHYYFSDNLVDAEDHKLESLTALAEQLEMVASAEELFNAALVGQKRRELLRKKAAPGTDGLLADY